ncbi:hypothetical protein P7K49_028374 [Saguinus oedipus]|uniref:Uncharacterized protein n=1 Tax=Saguinus oedipus TaxID=9490 RepID=A0ABQ9UCC0_SAGOE|nr:hypothetical protein P7K49_028374 [Saguinus oedipus]
MCQVCALPWDSGDELEMAALDFLLCSRWLKKQMDNFHQGQPVAGGIHYESTEPGQSNFSVSARPIDGTRSVTATDYTVGELGRSHDCSDFMQLGSISCPSAVLGGNRAVMPALVDEVYK